jgi:hypothetical protein
VKTRGRQACLRWHVRVPHAIDDHPNKARSAGRNELYDVQQLSAQTFRQLAEDAGSPTKSRTEYVWEVRNAAHREV